MSIVNVRGMLLMVVVLILVILIADHLGFGGTFFGFIVGSIYGVVNQFLLPERWRMFA